MTEITVRPSQKRLETAMRDQRERVLKPKVLLLSKDIGILLKRTGSEIEAGSIVMSFVSKTCAGAKGLEMGKMDG